MYMLICVYMYIHTTHRDGIIFHFYHECMRGPIFPLSYLWSVGLPDFC